MRTVQQLIPPAGSALFEIPIDNFHVALFLTLDEGELSPITPSMGAMDMAGHFAGQDPSAILDGSDSTYLQHTQETLVGPNRVWPAAFLHPAQTIGGVTVQWTNPSYAASNWYVQAAESLQAAAFSNWFALGTYRTTPNTIESVQSIDLPNTSKFGIVRIITPEPTSNLRMSALHLYSSDNAATRRYTAAGIGVHISVIEPERGKTLVYNITDKPLDLLICHEPA